MEKIDSIIQAKWLITDEQTSPLENHALAIQAGKILAMSPIADIMQRYTADHIEKYSSHAVFPGLINSHTHLAMNYFRGLADDLALMNWLNNYIWPAEKKWVSYEFARDSALFAMAEMIRSGTTCFNDMYDFPNATADAAKIAGLRGFASFHIIEFPTNWANTMEERFTLGLEFLEQYKNHPTVSATLAPHAPYTVSDNTFLRVKEIAEQYNLKINLHLHETADEVNQSMAQINKRPLRRMQELGLLSPRLIAIHMTQLNDEDLAIIAATKPNVVHCPESNMKLASGVCPVEKLQRLGINVALGTDGAASNNDLNMLGEMRSAAFLAKLTDRNPESVSASDALKLATLNGAKALGIDQITGSLRPGKAADFAVINLDEIETQPIYHPISHLVYAASRQQVTDTWVAGKQLMKNRQLLTLDENELLAKAKQWSEKIKS
jgi:5-methylthioadenosine/S-adenosylhomocysteine deaminase